MPTFWRRASRSERCEQAFRPRSHRRVPINCGTPAEAGRPLDPDLAAEDDFGDSEVVVGLREPCGGAGVAKFVVTHDGAVVVPRATDPWSQISAGSNVRQFGDDLRQPVDRPSG